MDDELISKDPQLQLDDTERQALVRWFQALLKVKASGHSVLALIDVKKVDQLLEKINEQKERAVQLARKINDQLDDAQRQALISWLEALLKIKESPVSATDKMKMAVTVTQEAHIVRPLVIIVSKEVKRIGWDERSWATRLAMSGTVAAAATFGSEGAGIAAFGGAIGVPLWIVCRAGAAFAGVLLDELLPAAKK